MRVLLKNKKFTEEYNKVLYLTKKESMIILFYCFVYYSSKCYNFFDGTKCYNFIYLKKILFIYEYELLKCEKHYL